MSLKSAFHSLLDVANLPAEVIHRLKEEVEVPEVPDTVPDEKEGE